MSLSRIMVTGANGFVGTHLCLALAAEFDGAEIIRIGGPDATMCDENVDMSDASAVTTTIAKWRPTSLVHLAAVSAVTQASLDPTQAWAVNATSLVHLGLAVQQHAPDCHLLLVSSAEVYGASFEDGAALREDATLRPLNLYAASKVAAEAIVGQFIRSSSLFATIARPFNHTGPGQPTGFVIPDFASQIVAIERGMKMPVLQVGNLEYARDFLDVEDVVRAYLRIVRLRNALPNGLVLNVASGISHRVGDLLNLLLAQTKVEMTIIPDPHRQRQGAQVVRGDASRAAAYLGWMPAVSIETTLKRVLDYQRKR